MSEEEMPQAIIDAENQATPARKWRLAGAGVFGVLSVGSGAVCVASLSGNAGASEIAANISPFGNVVLGTLIDLAVAASCVWGAQQEIATRDANRKRILEEVLRRKSGKGGSPTGPNRFERRAGKRERARQADNERGFAPRPAATSLANAASADDAAGTAAETPTGPSPMPEPPKGGLSALWEEANALGRAQALELNRNLEERGVLPPLAGASTAAPSGSEVAAKPKEADGAATSTSGSEAASNGGEVAQQRERKPRAQKRKKRKKR